MSILNKILDQFPNEGYNKVAGFDQAIIGVSSRSNLVYSIDKCIEILQQSGLSHDQAVEHFYNELDAMYVGVGAPIFIQTL
jgi:hypothetical protein